MTSASVMCGAFDVDTFFQGTRDASAAATCTPRGAGGVCSERRTLCCVQRRDLLREDPVHPAGVNRTFFRASLCVSVSGMQVHVRFTRDNTHGKRQRHRASELTAAAATASPNVIVVVVVVVGVLNSSSIVSNQTVMCGAVLVVWQHGWWFRKHVTGTHALRTANNTASAHQ